MQTFFIRQVTRIKFLVAWNPVLNAAWLTIAADVLEELRDQMKNKTS